MDNRYYTIPAGTYGITGDDEKRYYALSIGTGGSVGRAGLCDPFYNLTIPKDNAGKLCVQTVFGFHACYDANFRIVDVETRAVTEHGAPTPEVIALAGTTPIPRSGPDTQTLVYSGLGGGIARFTYISQVFRNDVTYDLARSNIINYRGARIEIHRYNNEQIEYTVLKNFPQRELREKALTSSP